MLNNNYIEVKYTQYIMINSEEIKTIRVKKPTWERLRDATVKKETFEETINRHLKFWEAGHAAENAHAAQAATGAGER